jgi:hypothetical protein
MAGVEEVITEAEAIMIEAAVITEVEDITGAEDLTEAATNISDRREKQGTIYMSVS